MTGCPDSTVTTHLSPGPHFPNMPKRPPHVSLKPRAHTIQHPQISRTVPPTQSIVSGHNHASQVLQMTLSPQTFRMSSTITIHINVPKTANVRDIIIVLVIKSNALHGSSLKLPVNLYASTIQDKCIDIIVIVVFPSNHRTTTVTGETFFISEQTLVHY